LPFYQSKGFTLTDIIYTKTDTISTDLAASSEALILETDLDSFHTLSEAGFAVKHVVFPAKYDGLEASVGSLDELYNAVDTGIDEFALWGSYHALETPVRYTGEVTHGFGRGSRQLGFPTANLTPITATIQGLVPGVYAAWAEMDGTRYQAAVSVGWNP
jgi:hypothetical protein